MAMAGRDDLMGRVDIWCGKARYADSAWLEKGAVLVDELVDELTRADTRLRRAQESIARQNVQLADHARQLTVERERGLSAERHATARNNDLLFCEQRLHETVETLADALEKGERAREVADAMGAEIARLAARVTELEAQASAVPTDEATQARMADLEAALTYANHCMGWQADLLAKHRIDCDFRGQARASAYVGRALRGEPHPWTRRKGAAE